MKQTGRLNRRPLRPPLEPSLRQSGFRGASPAQRAKVLGRTCLACGLGRRVDPAHLVPRAKGGCDHPDCVVPLCRRCHRAFDDGALKLGDKLGPAYGPELTHALKHVTRAALERRLRTARAIAP